MNNTSPKPFVLVLIYLAAGAAMIFLSYSLPRMLPGDFVTAMYASSHVTLNEQQEAEIKAYYTQQQGFAVYVGKLFRLDWGYSTLF